MTDQKDNSEIALQSPTSIEQNSTKPPCTNSSDTKPGVPAGGKNDQLFARNNDAGCKKTLEVEVQQHPKPKEKGKKSKKKKSEKPPPAGEAPLLPPNTSVPLFEQPPVPVYCKKCLGRNVGKKGERSDAYVITCSKCGFHEVLMKPDGNGLVKIGDHVLPGGAPQEEALPQGDLLDAAWKSVGDKVLSALKPKDYEISQQQNEQQSSRISTFAQCLKHCSRECADLYPLIINLRSLQLKKTSSTPQQRNVLETEVKERLSLLEHGIGEIESFETKYLKKSPAAPIGASPNSLDTATADAAKKKKCPSTHSSSSAGATSAEAKESTVRANSSLFDPLTPAATSPPVAAVSTGEENKTASGQATGGATANVSSSAGAAASSKTKSSPWYIEKAEQLNSRLEVMHFHLAKYTMIHSLFIQNKLEEDIAATKKNEAEVINSLQGFTKGLVDQCQNTTKECCQKLEIRRNYIKNKQTLVAEARTLAEECIANGDDEGLQRIQEMLRQNNLEN